MLNDTESRKRDVDKENVNGTARLASLNSQLFVVENDTSKTSSLIRASGNNKKTVDSMRHFEMQGYSVV